MSQDGYEVVGHTYAGHPIHKQKEGHIAVIMYDQRDNLMTFAEFEMALIKGGMKPAGNWMVVSKERFAMLGGRTCVH